MEVTLSAREAAIARAAIHLLELHEGGVVMRRMESIEQMLPRGVAAHELVGLELRFDPMPAEALLCTSCGEVIEQSREPVCVYPVWSPKVPEGGRFHWQCCPYHSGRDRS